MSEKNRIAKAAGLMSVATLISRVLGYVRDMILAFFLGATGMSDTFFVAFRIPNLLRELFAEGSMSSAVIPVLTEYQGKDPEGAVRLARITLTFIMIVVGLICLAGIVFAPALVAAIAPGFIGDPVKFGTTVTLTRIMFPFLLFISMAALVMGALNARRVFFIPALAPAMLNVTIITTVLLLVSRAVSPVTAAAIGVALGGLVQFAFQCPSFIGRGYSMRPDFGFSHPGLKTIGTLVLPATIGMAVAQINIVVSNILASYLAEGSITYLFYSMRLVQFPIGVFGVAMGMAVLPSLSAHAVAGRHDLLREDFAFALRLLLFISVPAMAGLIALREPIVNLLFQRGRFDYEASRGTAQALFFYATGVWAFVGVKVLAATFYSLKDTKTPMKIAIFSLTANVLLSLALMGPLKHSGLAFANALASMANFLLLFYYLRRRLGRLGTRKTLVSVLKTCSASALMGLVAYALISLRGELWSVPGEALFKSAYLFGTIAVCVLCYIVSALALKSEEIGFLTEAAKNRIRRKHQ